MEFTHLTKDEIKLIQSSWIDLTNKSKIVGEKFYERLFKRSPEIKELFKGDLKEQAGALMRMVKTVVEGLNNPQIIIPALQELGRRHNEYGVKFEHYKGFGDCLIDCIEEELKPTFDAQTRKAWDKLYGMLAEVMKN